MQSLAYCVANVDLKLVLAEKRETLVNPSSMKLPLTSDREAFFFCRGDSLSMKSSESSIVSVEVLVLLSDPSGRMDLSAGRGKIDGLASHWVC